MNLTQILADLKSRNSKNIPRDKWEIMERSTNQLKNDDWGAKSIKEGAIFPAFNLPDINGTSTTLEDFNNDFLIISFYRGGWCPFCNLELKALQDILPNLKDLNTDLIAITPETPDNSLSTSEKNDLSFSILSDINNTYAKSLGLVFKLPEDLIAVYKTFNINIDQHNNNQDNELPMPATYILNKNKKIIYSFVPEDYTERLDTQDILKTIKNHSKL